MTSIYARVLAVCITALCGGCANPPAGHQPFELRDDLGRSVRLQTPVSRVVSLAPSLTEIIFAAGAGHMVAGVTTADDYPPPSIRCLHSVPCPWTTRGSRHSNRIL